MKDVKKLKDLKEKLSVQILKECKVFQDNDDDDLGGKGLGNCLLAQGKTRGLKFALDLIEGEKETEVG